MRLHAKPLPPFLGEAAQKADGAVLCPGGPLHGGVQLRR
jgi:hypothetical protein